MPPAEQVRDALERVLASESFARSERARNLLRYLVEQDLEGHGDRLKGYSIAVDVFGKDDSFDPATDTVVRVQAGRLRDLLDHYYAQEGSGERLRITVPRGSYLPEYRTDAGDEALSAPGGDEAAAPVVAPNARRWSTGRPAFAVAGLFLVLAAAAWLALSPPNETGGEMPETAAADMALLSPPAGFDDQTDSVHNKMLPLLYLDLAQGDYGADNVASALRRGLSGFDTIHFIGRPPDQQEADSHRRTDFVFILEPSTLSGEVHLELQNLASGKVLLSRNLATANRSQAAIDNEIADILTLVAPASGIIYANVALNGAETMLIRCMSLNEIFYRDMTARTHRDAYQCFEELVALEVRSELVYSGLASLHMQAIANNYDYPTGPTPQQALDFARLAVQLAPDSPYAHRSMGYVLSRTAGVEEALRWARKAYELNPFDLGMAAAYGYALIFNGDYVAGTPVLEHAVATASSHSTWWDYGLFLGKLMLGDMDGAASAVSPLASSGRAHYVAASLIAADGLDDRDRSAVLLREMVSRYPSFSADPGAYYRGAGYPDDMATRLLEALRDAGLGSAS